MRTYFPLGKDEPRDIDHAIKLHTEVRRLARELLRKFKDRGDHYEYTGGMNAVNALEDAVDAVEGYEITGQA